MMKRQILPDLAGLLQQNNLDDATQRWVMEWARQQQDTIETLHAVIDQLPNLICRYDQQGNIVYANLAFRSQFGRPEHQLLGRRIDEFVPLGTPEQVTLRLQRLFKLPTTIVSDVQLADTRGHKTWHQWIETSITNADGRVVAVQAYSQDASLRYAADVVLEQAIRHYRTIVQHLPRTVVLMFDYDLRYVLAAGDTVAVLERGIADIEGKTIDEVWSGPQLESAQTLYRHILEGATPSFEYQRENRYYSLTGLPIQDMTGRIEHGIVIVTDISTYKQAEKARLQTQQQLALIADNINEVLFVYNPVLDRLDYVSDAYERVFGLPDLRTYRNPRAVVRHVQRQDRWLLYDYWRDGVMLHEEGSLEVRLKPDPVEASERWVLVRTFPVWDAERQVQRVVGMAKDITLQRKSEEQSLSLALERERIRILTEFIDKASHEFRTPLSIINTNAYLMSSVHERDQLAHYRRAIENQVQNIAYFVERLVLMSKLDGITSIKGHATVLQSVLQEMLTKIQSKASTQNVSIDTQLEGKRLTIHAEAHYIGIAVRELLDNALKAMPNGGQLKVELRSTDRWYMILIADTGVGMTDEVMSKIFKRFYRADTAHTTQGFGLGLPIARRIIDLHGGHISVESSVGRGSTFSILLPIRLY